MTLCNRSLTIPLLFGLFTLLFSCTEGANSDQPLKEEVSWKCGDPLNYQGYEYATVLIGEQCWFAENLQTTKYRNAEVIRQDFSEKLPGRDLLGVTTSSAMGFYDDYKTYGGLYNWYAVNDTRGLCPSGWHVPSDGEWNVMTDHIGGASIAGRQIKAERGWYYAGNGTNSTGFSGLPGGAFYSETGTGIWSGIKLAGYWWSSTPHGSEAWSRYMHYVNASVDRDVHDKRNGFSVRCIKDAE